jgi:hypothetical protein
MRKIYTFMHKETISGQYIVLQLSYFHYLLVYDAAKAICFIANCI